MEASDERLIEIVDTALAEAARRSGEWLACKIGCAECCMGPFPISPLDAERLRRGLAELERRDPRRAARVKERAAAYAAQIEDLEELIDGETEMDDEPCPALDPETGACDLYAARPLTCRTFGPPVRSSGDDIGVCALCFRGATDEQIAACRVEIDIDELEAELLKRLPPGETVVALALIGKRAE